MVKPSQEELAAKLKLLKFKVYYNKQHKSYICSVHGFIFEIYTGIVIGWSLLNENQNQNQNQQIINYNIQSILNFMEN